MVVSHSHNGRKVCFLLCHSWVLFFCFCQVPVKHSLSCSYMYVKCCWSVEGDKYYKLGPRSLLFSFQCSYWQLEYKFSWLWLANDCTRQICASSVWSYLFCWFVEVMNKSFVHVHVGVLLVRQVCVWQLKLMFVGWSVEVINKSVVERRLLVSVQECLI